MQSQQTARLFAEVDASQLLFSINHNRLDTPGEAADYRRLLRGESRTVAGSSWNHRNI